MERVTPAPWPVRIYAPGYSRLRGLPMVHLQNTVIESLLLVRAPPMEVQGDGRQRRVTPARAGSMQSMTTLASPPTGHSRFHPARVGSTRSLLPRARCSGWESLPRAFHYVIIHSSQDGESSPLAQALPSLAWAL